MRNTVPLKEVVNEFLIERGQDTQHDFVRVLNAAIRALKELDWDLTGAPQSMFCNVDSNGQIDIPSDCIKILDVGLLNSKGEFISLDLNNQIASHVDFDSCGNQVSNTSTIGAAYASRGIGLDYNSHGENVGRQYGLGGGSVFGSYNIDYPNSKINLSAEANRGEYLIVYMSNLKTLNGEILVNEFMQEPLLAGIEWILKRRVESISRSEKRELKKNFFDEKHNLSLRLSSLTFNQMMAAGWRSVKPSKF